MKKLTWLALGVAMVLAFSACGKKEEPVSEPVKEEVAAPAKEEEKEAEEPAKEEDKKTENAGMANPWTESDKQGVLDATGFEMTAPEGATDVAYSYMKDSKMAQMTYKLDGADWTYRIQPANELTDISGMNYEWTSKDDGKVKGLEAKYLTYSDAKEGQDTIDGANGVQVVNWYDPAAGVTYSLSATGNDLNGMDIQVYAENVYVPLQGNA